MASLNRKKRVDHDALDRKFQQGLRLEEAGRLDEAESRFRKILRADPTHTEALTKIIAMLQAAGRTHDALSELNEAAGAENGTATHFMTLARLYSDFNDPARAEVLYEEALCLLPDHEPLLVNLGNLLAKRGERQRAADLLSHAIEINPGSGLAFNSLGRVLAEAGMFEEAYAAYQQAVGIAPMAPETHINLGSLYLVSCQPALAMKELETALNLIQPHQDNLRDAICWNLALSLLAAGHLEQGWDLYGFGFSSGERKPLRPFPDLIWEGEDISDKTIMVWREQGLGDDFRFSTCYHDLIKQAKHVIIECDPRVVAMYQRTWPTATVRPSTNLATGFDNYDDVDFDVTAPTGIMAAQLRRSLDRFEANPPYLIACPDRRAQARQWLDSLGPKPKIGFAWRSGIKDPVREIWTTSIADWLPLLRDEAFDIINLQYADPREELDMAARELGVTIHEMPGLDTHGDLEGVGALTSELDFIIAPWNAASEFAGALGTKGIIYAPASHPNLLGQPDFPWYPTLKVMQIKPGFDRADLCARVHTAARARLA